MIEPSAVSCWIQLYIYQSKQLQNTHTHTHITLKYQKIRNSHLITCSSFHFLNNVGCITEFYLLRMASDNLVRSASSPIATQWCLNLVSRGANRVPESQSTVSKTSSMPTIHDEALIILLEQIITSGKHGKHKGIEMF